MNKVFLVLLIFTQFSCNKRNEKIVDRGTSETHNEIITNDYILVRGSLNPEATLILFSGFPDSAQKSREKFRIDGFIKNYNISVLFMNYNQRLWLRSNELEHLDSLIYTTLQKHNLPKHNIVIGGFSSGGNMALILSNYMASLKNPNFTTKGVFIIDSPIDLEALYYKSKKSIDRNFSSIAVNEGTFLVNYFEEYLGDPSHDLANYEKHSVYTSTSDNLDNLMYLKGVDIRLYTEPDTLWWKENRKTAYKELNAYVISKMYESMLVNGFKNVELIATKGKGYRLNGERHPHSWSIVDKNDLLDWILPERSGR